MRRWTALSILAALALLAQGCGDDKSSSNLLCPANGTCSAENTVHDFGAVYILKDATTYRALLTSDFVFRLSVDDVIAGGPDSLTQTQEMAFVEHFFRTGSGDENPPAERVSMLVTIQTVTQDNRIGHEGWKKYIVSTRMTARFANGNDVVISSPAYLYFREAPVGSGIWRLAEWVDQTPDGNSGAPSRAGAGTNSAKSPAGINGESWGRLKVRYL